MIDLKPKFSFEKLNRIDSPDGRLYETPSGDRYPSVTTILSETKDSDFLTGWYERVGEEEGKRLTRMAAKRGTGVHEYLEKFIAYGDLDNKKENPFIVHLAMPIVRYLKENVKEFHHSEIAVYSNRYRFAGTCDCVATLKNGTLAIIDFKTSYGIKTEEMIQDYYLQCAAYSLAIKELTGTFINKSLILISSENCNVASSFEIKNSDYVIEFINRRKALLKQNGK